MASELQRPENADPQSRFEQRVARYLSPFQKFIDMQPATGILLIAATFMALLFANSGLHDTAEHLAELHFGFVLDDWAFLLSLREWVSDGLLALFFFLIGLEIKRELLAGSLRHRKHVLMIVVAACGGMMVPALIYTALNHGTPGQAGWAIPMATDTAFAVGILALLARFLSPAVAVFLAALAIIDDLGAILVIAFFYTQDLQMVALIRAAAVFTCLLLVNRAGIRRGSVYVLLGLLLWWYVYQSGIHATLAGILLAAAIPSRPKFSKATFIERARALLFTFEVRGDQQRKMLETPEQHSLAVQLEGVVKAASTPLQRWETFLGHPVMIVILPLFALLNAGVVLNAGSVGMALTSPVTQGIILGLVIGKPAGITLGAFLVYKAGWGVLPRGVRFREVIAAGLLAGIGFTMSVFIATLGFGEHPELVADAKIGILLSSLLAALLGSLWASLSYRPAHPAKALNR